MKLWRIFIVLFFCLGLETLSAQYITVDDTYTAQQLVENVLVSGPCANTSNFAISGGFFGGANSYGYFNAGTSGFPFAKGIVLSTCQASSTVGPNDSLLSEDAPNWLGDSDLEQALTISNTSNATYLEFDFVPLTSQISFDYIFASEEYHDTAPCHYSDGFAFLLKQVGGGSYENLAIIPNTSIPVKVTTVHPTVSGGSGCPAQNESYFGGYNSGNAPINFNGQTVVMTAKATVIPGATYHIKLVIADESNPLYDSAIFLGAGSFSVGTDLGPDRLVATNNPLCNNDTYVLDATEPGTNTYKWFKDGIAIAGAVNPTYTVTEAGTYKVEITINSTACIATGEVTIEYVGVPGSGPFNLVQCDDNNDGIATFNLTKLTSTILQGSSQANTVTFYQNLYDANHHLNPITNPTTFQNTTTSQVIAEVTNAFGCNSLVTINLQIANNPLPTISTIPICDEDGTLDGFTTFSLSQTVTPQVLNGLPAGLLVEYYPTAADAYAQTHIVNDTYTNTSAYNQILYARIINGPDCYGILPVPLHIVSFAPSGLEHENAFLCDGGTTNLGVPNGFSSYTWNTGAVTPSITVAATGDYSVTVTNTDGCSATKTFTVTASGAPVITSIDINDFSENSNTVQVNVSGSGDYEYSLDGEHFQDSSLFTNVYPDQYTIVVRDKNGCNPNASQTIYVLDYPKYFTPNGDGFHDTWQIKNLSYYPNAMVAIYDRFGKFLYNFKVNQSGWDGKVNQRELFADDYWFVITLGNGRVIKGHFSLKR